MIPMPILAKHFSHLLKLSLTLLAGACLALPPLLAQEKAANPPQIEADPTAAAHSGPESEFEQSQAALREHLKAMRTLQVEYHLSSTNSGDGQFRRQWAELCDRGRPLFARALAAMIKKFTDNPTANQDLGAFLYELLDRNSQDSRFEGMLQLALVLESNGVSGAKLPEMIALSAVSENKFDVAKPWMEKHFTESPKPRPALGAIYQNLDALRNEWSEELRLREEDAKGEPLPQVSILTTKGEVVVELFENQAPETVGNFVHLVEEGFFDGLAFHRVLEHFVAQTGCPENDGTGGPGYAIYSEAQKPNARKFFRGSLGVALSQSDPNSGGSQFFICFLPTFNLNGQYTSFGRIISGIEVIGNLTHINPEDEKKDEEPKVLDEIIEAKVLRKRNHEYAPHKVTK
jgi:cyclophilin family peptidyl-prolyl cis-trans isomerase